MIARPSNYPNGFNNGVSIRGIPILNSYGKAVRWVDSGGASNGDGSFNRPYSTLQRAIDAADSDDTVIIKPGHSETITGAGGLTFDVPGLMVQALGFGTRRATFLMDGAASVTAAVTGADTSIQNVRFLAGHADITTMFDLDAAGFNLVGCEFNDYAANENWLSLITSGSTTDNVCDYMRLIGNRWHSPDAACLNFLAQTGHADHMEISGNVVCLPGGTNSALVKTTSGDLFRDVLIAWNFLQHAMTANELFVNNDGSTNSGLIAHNRVGHADVTTSHDLGIDGLGCRLFDNLSTSTGSVSGFVLPAIDADS